MKRFILILISIWSISTITSQPMWITYIPDSIPVSRLSIPGSHDSATGEGIKGLFKMGITQNKSISAQWECGIRAFDLRPAVCDNKLHIYHGPLKTKITFSAAIDTILSCIDKNPQEFAIIIIRQEQGNDNAEERELWSELVGREINKRGERAAIFHPEITVRELRGKILFLSRNHYEGSHKGALIGHWSHSVQGSENAIITPYAIHTNNRSATLYVQDFYSLLTKEKQLQKIESIKRHMDKAAVSSTDTWCINHLSGYCTTLFGFLNIPSNKGYKQNAQRNNRAIYEYLSRPGCNIKTDTTIEENKRENNTPTPYGIIMIDYAGCEKVGKYTTYGTSIIQAIIDKNFATKPF